MKYWRNLTRLRNRNLKRETKSLLITALNNSIRTNYITVKVDNAQQKSKSRLCGDKDETIYHQISEYSKLAQKDYKTRYDWAGKVVHWELYRILKFDYTTKWYLHKPESIRKNET